jgi:serine/threonine protein kinase
MMRKWKIALAGLLVLTTGFGVMAMGRMNRNVILLYNGRTIPVDRTWESGNDLFYENENEIHFVSRAEIKSIGARSPVESLQAAGDQCTQFVNRRLQTVAPLLQGVAQLSDRWSIHPAAAAAPLLLLLLVASLRWVRGRPAGESVAPPAPPVRAPGPEELPRRADVVRFFLNLYRHQLGADADAPSEFVQLPSGSGPNRTYELRVKHHADWVKRRMSIGPLGEDSGSKSTCYYVIFDQHLVVKIPPKPIRNFEDYVAGLKKERHIVERLAPRECIVPTVSVILDRVHPIPAAADATAEAFDEKHIAWLRKSVDAQEHLKINGTFVYFMDLSQHRFLSHIIDAAHDVSEAVHAEIIAVPDIVRTPGKFKDRYVAENESVGFEIRDLFNQCEAEISRQLKQQGKSAVVPPYRIQKWFLQFLENRRLGEMGEEISPELAASVAYVFAAHFRKYQASVDAFLAAVRRFAAMLAIDQNKQVVSGIITNLLDLLGDLERKKVAMRDLKPDNLLVAGDPQRYPAFLRSPGEYSLGIIDVETAVVFGSTETGQIRQPLLGGTPYYATPTHLMPNAVLERCYGDPGRILHFQDWQAVLVMIYKAVTGELLFDRTAQHFVEIKTQVIQAIKEHQPLEKRLEELSRGFWQNAVDEFRAGMRAREQALRMIEADIPSGARRMFLQALRHDAASIAEAIRRIVAAQSRIPSAAGREQLIKCSHAQICRFMQELEFKARAGAVSTESAQQTLTFFKRIINLKALHERKTQLAAVLEVDPARLSAYDLLMFMFNRVLKAMYREDWKPLAEEPAAVTCRPDDELSLSTTI